MHWKKSLVILMIALGILLALIVLDVFRDQIAVAVLVLIVALVFLALCGRHIRSTILNRYGPRLMNSRRYWRVRFVQRALGFLWARLSLRLREWLSGKWAGARTLAQLLRDSTRDALLGFAIATALLLAAHHNQENAVVATSWLLGNIDPSSESSYDAALIAIITVTGVVLTLYFSIRNTLIGSRYPELPERIRDLLLDDRQSNVSIRLLTTLAIYVLVSLAGGTLHEMRPNASMLLAVLWTVLAIPTIAFLAKRTFDLFDPTNLADSVFNNLSKQAHSVTHVRSEAIHASVQNYRMELADDAVTILQTFSKMAIEDENLRHDALVQLLENMFDFLPAYLPRKRQMPLQSRWYKRTPEYKDWYLTPHYEVSFATATQTSLEPNNISDHDWLEKRFMSIFEESFERLVGESSFPLAFQLLDVSQAAFAAFGMEFQIQSASQSLPKLSTALVTQLTLEGTTASETDHHVQLRVLDLLVYLPNLILMSFSAALQTLNIEDLVKAVKRVRWERDSSLYKPKFPFFMLSKIEYLQHRLKFELAVDGHLTSAQWYITQLAVVHPVADMLQSQLTELLHLGTETYIKKSDKLIESGRTTAATFTINRGLEFSNKLPYLVQQILATMAAIEHHRIEHEIDFAEINTADIIQQITSLEHHLLKNLARCVPRLTQDERFHTSETPDLLGQALNTLGEKYYSALAENDVELTTDVFLGYFQGTLIKQALLAQSTTHYEFPVNLTYSCQPLTELLTLSGYAFLFSEYHQEPSLWESCKSVWEPRLSISENEKLLLQLLQRVGYAKSQPFMSPRFATTTQWQQDFTSRMVGLPLVPLSADDDNAFHRPQVRKHPSLVLRALLLDWGSPWIMHHDPIDVFVSLYLRDELPISDLDEQYYQDVREDIKNQKEREQHHGFRIGDWLGLGQDD